MVVVEIVRREKALDFSGCNSRPELDRSTAARIFQQPRLISTTIQSSRQD
jgi:hypothetical protein